MLKKILAATLAFLSGLALVAQPALARFDLHFADDTGGSAYEWYVQRLVLDYNLETYDGAMPTGEPYILFKGNSASPNGHCLEISFTPGAAPPPYIQVKVNDHGTYKVVTNVNLQSGGYPTMRLWVHRNTATSSLNWALYVAANDNNTTFVGQVLMDVRRLEVSKAGCTTAQIGGVSDPATPFPWVSFEGRTSQYTITKGNF